MNTPKLRKYGVLTLSLSLSMLATSGSYATKKPEAATTNSQQNSQASKLNGLAQAAANAGVLDCVGRVQQVTDFIAGRTKTGAFLFLPPTEPNAQLLSASMETQMQNASTYASASFAPNGHGGCDAVYETVAFWGGQCEEVAKKVFTGFTVKGKLHASVTMLDGGVNSKAFLMPVANGCLSIKKEIIY